MIELADRVYWIVGLVIAVVLVARKYGNLTGRVTPPDSSPIDIRDDIGEINAEDSIENLPMRQRDIVHDQAFVINQLKQQMEQEDDQLRQRMEQQREEFRQRMEQRFQQIEQQQRCPM